MTEVAVGRSDVVSMLKRELNALSEWGVEPPPMIMGNESDPVDISAQGSTILRDAGLAKHSEDRRKYLIPRIKHVLKRLNSGWDATCECGSEIPIERLIAIPGTEHCVLCKAMHDEPTSVRIRI